MYKSLKSIRIIKTKGILKMNRIKLILFATAAMLFVRFALGWLISLAIEMGADALLGLYVVNIMAGIIGGFVVLMLTRLNQGKLLFANLASVGLIYFVFFLIAIVINFNLSRYAIDERVFIFVTA